MSKTLSGLRREGGCLLRRHSGKGPQLPLRGESPGFSLVAVEFLSHYNGGNQGPARGASGRSSLPASHEGPLGFPLLSILGPKSSSGVEAGTSGSSPVLT